MNDNKNRIYSAIFLFVLLGAIALGYGHTLNSPFLLDDWPNIVRNPYIRIDSLSFSSLGKVFSPYQPSNRPVANLSFALNYLVGGIHPFGFHLVNILIHILTAIVVFRLCSFYFLKAGFSGKDSIKLAAITALLWALNPLQINAVTYIVQRMTSLCTLLFSTSLLAYVHARRLQLSDGNKRGQFKVVIFFLVSIIFWLLAMMTKEIAAIMPVIILLHEFFFFESTSSGKDKNLYRAAFYSAIFFLPLLLYMAVFFRVGFWHGVMGGYATRDFTLGERLLTEGRVVVRYMSLFLLPLPSRMKLYYDYQISSSLIDPISTLLSILLLSGLLIFSFVWAKKYRLLSFGLLWTLSCLVIESTFLPLELIFEHRFYLPSIGFSIAIVALSFQLCHSLFKNKQVFHVFWVAVLCMMVVMTYMRNQDWRSELSFSLDGVKKTPNLVRAVNDLAGAYMRLGEFGKEKEALDRALQLKADNVVILSNLFMFAADRKKPVQAEDYLRRMEQSIKDGHFRCNQSTSLLLASEVLFERGRFDDVIYLLESLQSCRAKNAVYYDNLALCYARIGNHRQAIENFHKALERDPGNPYYMFSLVRQYIFNRDREKALAMLKKLNNTPVPDELKPHVDELGKYLLGR